MSEEPRGEEARKSKKRHEKGEKDEKEEEKKDEKEEKSWEEKWQRDPVRIGMWAAILIWVGVVLLLENFDLLGSWETWSVIFIGVGVILLGNVTIRLLVPEHRRPVVGTLILGAVFLSVGLGGLLNWGIVWALVLIAIGVAILLRGFTRRR